LLGSQQGWHDITAGWPLRGGSGKKYSKTKKRLEKMNEGLKGWERRRITREKNGMKCLHAHTNRRTYKCMLERRCMVAKV